MQNLAKGDRNEASEGQAGAELTDPETKPMIPSSRKDKSLHVGLGGVDVKALGNDRALGRRQLFISP